MSQIERMAADVTIGTPHARTTVTTANGERVEVPDEMAGKFCVFTAETSDVWIRFGDGTVQVDETQTSTLTGEAVTTAGAKVPHLYVPAGSEKQIRLKAAWTHFAHKSANASGKLRFALATGAFGTD